MKRVFLSVVCVLAIAGCASDVVESRLASEVSMDACPEGHVIPPEVSVVIYQQNGRVFTVPRVVVVESPEQEVVWTSVNGEISDITFEPSSCAPAPPPVNGSGRQLRDSFPPGYRGAHKYTYMFTPDTKDEPVKVDPVLIIEY